MLSSHCHLILWSLKTAIMKKQKRNNLYTPKLQLPSRSCYTGIPSFYVAHKAILQSGQPANPLSQRPCNWEGGISWPRQKITRIYWRTWVQVLFFFIRFKRTLCIGTLYAGYSVNAEFKYIMIKIFHSCKT